MGCMGVIIWLSALRGELGWGCMEDVVRFTM